jgi:LacI family transcriptional regulator
VVTGRRLKAPNLNALDFDNREGARLATQHLIDLGHRRIAFISGAPEHPDAIERQRGYQSALEAAGLRVDPAIVQQGDFSERSGLSAVERLFAGRGRFSAIFAANDQMAFGAAIGIHRQGKRVPQDVSLVGFDDLAGSVYFVPPLTTVHNPIHEIGELAARAMLGLLAGETTRCEVPAPRLVIRESTRSLTA